MPTFVAGVLLKLATDPSPIDLGIYHFGRRRFQFGRMVFIDTSPGGNRASRAAPVAAAGVSTVRRSECPVSGLGTIRCIRRRGRNRKVWSPCQGDRGATGANVSVGRSPREAR